PAARAGRAETWQHRAYGLMRDERTAGLSEWTKGLIAGDGAEDLVIIPWLGGLGRRLHLREQHVVHKAAVLAHMAVLDVEIVHRQLAHPRHHSLRLIGAGRLDRRDVMAHG